MSPDPFGFPPVPHLPGERYTRDSRQPDPEADAARRTRPWGAAEQVGILPLLLEAPSEHAYIATCAFLCDVLDRRPFTATDKPTPERERRECLSLVERRTITGVLTGDARLGWRPDVRLLLASLPAPRTGRPLAWAERVRFLQPWARKGAQEHPRVDFDDLQALVGRDLDDPAPGDYVASLPPSGRRDEPGASSPWLADAPTRTAVASLLRAFVARPTPDAWAALNSL